MPIKNAFRLSEEGSKSRKEIKQRGKIRQITYFSVITFVFYMLILGMFFIVNTPQAQASDAPGFGFCIDIDNDGYGLYGSTGCKYPEADCDDINPNVNPGADEICDGWDNNCNDFLDEAPECDPCAECEDEDPVKNSSIEGCKWNDLDGDGFWNETAFDIIDGWEINLFDGKATTTILTNQYGCYLFDDLEAGSYVVSETMKQSWTQTFPNKMVYPSQNNYFVHYIELGENKDVIKIHFGNHKTQALEPVCGNSVIETGEQCDDGNTDNGDGCSASCQTESNGGGGGGIAPVCGNSVIETGEQCDDGNTADGDGCSASCQTESNGGSGGIIPVCGNGDLEALEQCDDGNTDNGDGCSAVCQTEAIGGSSGSFFTYSDQGAGAFIPPAGSQNDTIVAGEEGEPKLEIKKTVDRPFANPGDKNIEYTVTVKNSGNLFAVEVKLIDTLPEGLIFADGSGLEKEMQLGDLAPGIEKSIKLLVNVEDNAEPDYYSNLAEASASNHEPVSATAEIEIKAVVVLAETGFSNYEFGGFVIALMGVLSLAAIGKRSSRT